MRKKIKSNKFSLRFKIVAFILVFAFVFQSMDTINWHTYGAKGVSIHKKDCTTPVHLSYFCVEMDNVIF
ncbi:hypothetical protein GCM10011444_16490 [Winogradskyella haliclonae]|uniref:Uncharacterized protein n=1 Tax=Winogradskyella haliclonae TaxID=2048558 RepID=A0ABQ2BXY6_9FLAO|nr:hypothetical protein GCM10011444_16490 [Winogradskyella haliclonae]